MTWVYLGNGFYTCKAADTKITTGVTTDSGLFEVDTGKHYTFNGTSWVLGTTLILNDQANTFGANYYDIIRMTAPASPAVNTLRLYVDTTDTHLKHKNSSGTVTDLTAGSGGATDLDSLTDVVITSAAAYQVIFRNSGNTAFVNSLIDDNNIASSAGIAKSKLAALNIGDSDVSSHTSTKITITDKTHLNANILYGDIDNALGAHFVDITKMTAPANPSANILRLYVDTADTHPKVRNNGGTIVDLSAAGDATLAGTQTFTGAKSFDLQISPKEIAAPSSPSAGYQALYIDSTSHRLSRKNSGGTVTMLEGLGVAELAGVSTQSGDATTTTFNIAHGLGSTPSVVSCIASTSAAWGLTYTYDSTNIIVAYQIAPPSGTNNLKFQWRVAA